MPSRDTYPRILATLVVGSFLFGLGFGSRRVTDRAWKAFTLYETPFVVAPLAEAPKPPRVRRAVVLLVDGLSYRGSLGMPFLNELRGRGADFRCQVGLPSFSMPGRAVLFTGAWQEVHGQNTNFSVRPLRVDTLFGAARRRSLRTAVLGGQSTKELIGGVADDVRVLESSPPVPDFSVLLRDLREATDAARALLSDPSPAFVFAELDVTDQAGHEWGGSSPQYEKAALSADEAIRSLSQSVDLARDVLVVTSDHGHTPTGGHGGGEPDVLAVPLVLTGHGVRAGVKGSAQQIDVAPTLAALLGTSVPASNQGRILLDGLATNPEEERALLTGLCEQRENFVLHYTRVVGLPPGGFAFSPPPCTGDKASLTSLLVRADNLERQVKEGRLGREMEERGRKATLEVLALAPVLLLAASLLEGSVVRLATLLGFLGSSLYYLLLPVAGLSYSFSSVNKDEALARFFQKDMALAAFGCGLAVLLAALKGRRGRSFLDAARLAFVAEGAFLLPILGKAALVYWKFGVYVRWSLPDPYWGFGFYMDALAVMAVGFLTPLWSLLAYLPGFLSRSGAGEVRGDGPTAASRPR